MKIRKWTALACLASLMAVAGCNSMQGILGGDNKSPSPGGTPAPGNVVEVRGTIAEVNVKAMGSSLAFCLPQIDSKGTRDAPGVLHHLHVARA